MKAMLYIHGKGGDAREWETLLPKLRDTAVLGFDYDLIEPWKLIEPLRDFAEQALRRYDSVSIFANSIGAFYTMQAFADIPLRKAYFLSPIVDMEGLIKNMISRAGLTEQELEQRRTVETAFGETLSWEYLCFVRSHPQKWKIPTDILYGELDHLTPRQSIETFAQAENRSLTIMSGGEHWFHTPEQLAFLQQWLKEKEGV